MSILGISIGAKLPFKMSLTLTVLRSVSYLLPVNTGDNSRLFFFLFTPESGGFDDFDAVRFFFSLSTSVSNLKL